MTQKLKTAWVQHMYIYIYMCVCMITVDLWIRRKVSVVFFFKDIYVVLLVSCFWFLVSGPVDSYERVSKAFVSCIFQCFFCLCFLILAFSMTCLLGFSAFV